MPQMAFIKKLVNFNQYIFSHNHTTNSDQILSAYFTWVIRICWNHEIVPFPCKALLQFKAWEEKYINMLGHATNVKLGIYKNHTILTYIKILHKLQDSVFIIPLGPYNVISQGNSYTLTAVYIPHMLSCHHPYQGQKDCDSSRPYFGHHIKIWLP